VKRWLQVLIIGSAALVTAVVGYILGIVAGPNQTVCHGTPTDGYCDTHAGHWAIVGLLVGLVIGGVVALALVRRRNLSHTM
jgi:Na+/glutamate symporter